MASRTVGALFVGLNLLLAAATPAQSEMAAEASQAEDMEPMYVDVSADPELAFISERVKLSGTTMGSDAANTVTVVVTPPELDGEPQEPKTLTAEVDANNTYIVVFEDTLTPGIYNVAVTAPDGRGTATTTFEMLDAPDIPDEVEEVVRLPIDEGERHIINVRQKLDELPDSPAKREIKGKLDDTAKQLARMKQNLPQLEAEITNAILASQAYPSLEEDMRVMRRDLFEKFKEVRAEARRSAEELKRLRQQTATCDSFEVIVEGLKWTSTMMDFFGGLKTVAANFAKEAAGMIAGAGAKQAGATENESFVASEVAKNADAIVKWELEGSTAIGLNIDFLAQGAAKMMQRYCEVYTGPVTAHMSAEFYSGGTMWWSYSFDLTGTITLHYPKDAGAGSIPVKGRIEGYGNNFKMWEDALTVLYPKLMASAVQRKKVIPPIEAPGLAHDFAAGLGSVAAAGMPNSFFIAVDGVIENNKISVIIGPARTDMSPKAKVLALILSPLVTFPVLTSYDLPYKDARFLLDRAAGSVAIDVPISAEGSVMKGEVSLENKKGGADAQGKYSMTLKLCNPDCDAKPAPSPKL